MVFNSGCLAVLPHGWTFLDECIDALLGIIGQHVVDHEYDRLPIAISHHVAVCTSAAACNPHTGTHAHTQTHTHLAVRGGGIVAGRELGEIKPPHVTLLQRGVT